MADLKELVDDTMEEMKTLLKKEQHFVHDCNGDCYGCYR